MVVIPLVFFTISSAIANMNSMTRLGKIMGSMMTIFVITGIIASVFMLVATVIFPRGTGADIPLETPDDMEHIALSDQIVNTFIFTDLVDLFFRESMFALIIFSVFIVLATVLSILVVRPFGKFL